MMINYTLRDLRGVNPYEKLALFIIDSRGDSYWASQDSLAEDMGACKSTVTRTLKGLEEKKLLIRKAGRGPGRSVIYQINRDLLGCDPEDTWSERPSTLVSQTITNSPTDHPTGSERPTKEELKFERKEEKKGSPRGEQLPFELCHALVLRAVDLGVLVEGPDGYRVLGNKKAVASIGQWAEFIEGKPEQERILRGMVESKESA